MIKQDEQLKDETGVEAPERDEAELDEAKLDNVHGGAGFLTGSLTAQQDATPWVNTGGGNADGFIMRDSVIVRTSGR